MDVSQLFVSGLPLLRLLPLSIESFKGRETVQFGVVILPQFIHYSISFLHLPS
jgi:hypothetical protein